jgi:transketolase
MVGKLGEMKDTVLIPDLEKIALEIRKDILKMIYAAGTGHPGASLSAVEIVTALYFREMRIDPAEPCKPDRDRFILSKGHACPVMYSALARRGYFPLDTLMTLRKINCPLQGHPDMKKTCGVDMTAGSLGNGLSIGVGMALGARLNGWDSRIYVLMGDGELQEGLIWEAAMSAAHYKLSNLVGIVDWNGLQLDGRVEDVMNINPLDAKWRDFGWHVLEIDGHDFAQIFEALDKAKQIIDRPTVILAHTVKGKGVSFMENQVDWHGKTPSFDEMKQAMLELGEDWNG